MAPISSPQMPSPGGGLVNRQLTPSSILGKVSVTPQKRGNDGVTQIPTPPSTGGLDEPGQFALPAALMKHKRCILRVRDEDESALAESTELEEDDLVDISAVSISSSPMVKSYGLQSSVTIAKDNVLPDNEGEALMATSKKTAASLVSSPFPFMELPLSVRKKIYEVLLVVPGLICVRQNHTSYHTEERGFLYTEPRQLLPGIAYALPQTTVNGFKIRFSRFRYTNAAILRTSKEVHDEAKAVMYGLNKFEIVCPNLEMSPPPDYKIKLFPGRYRTHVKYLSIRVWAFYPLKWLLNGGFSEIKNTYRGLDKLEIIVEMETGKKDLGKRLSKKEDEKWEGYVQRIHSTMSTRIFDGKRRAKALPAWLKIRVLFEGEAYDDASEPSTHNINMDLGPGNVSPNEAAEERLRRYHLKRGFLEAFSMFKKGGH